MPADRCSFQPREILVLKLRHIGDVLLATPVFSALAAAFAGARLSACLNEGTEIVLRDHPLVAQTLVVPRKKGKLLQDWRAELRLARALRTARFDLVVDLTANDRSAILARLSGAREKWGFLRRKGFLGKNRVYTKAFPKRHGAHVVRQQSELLRDCGLEPNDETVIFVVPEQARQSIAARFASPGLSLLHVHPVSRVMEKCWPANYMAEFLDALAARGLQPVITASRDETERAYVRDLISRMRTPAVDLTGQLSLQELGALSRHAKLFVGVDSAPMHIAAAVGAPVIGIFGPSSETLWGPWCERKLILARDLPCRLPCKNKNACPHHECLRAMTLNMVWDKTERFLDEVLAAGGAR